MPVRVHPRGDRLAGVGLTGGDILGGAGVAYTVCAQRGVPLAAVRPCVAEAARKLGGAGVGRAIERVGGFERRKAMSCPLYICPEKDCVFVIFAARSARVFWSSVIADKTSVSVYSS